MLALAALAGTTVGLWQAGAPDGSRRADVSPAPGHAWEAAKAAADRRAAERARYGAEMRGQEGAPVAAFGSGRGGGDGMRWTGAVRVVDGDTFWAGRDKIRVADIDTPEVRARCPAEAALAASATRRLGQLLAAGPFTLEPADRDEDRYGRKLRVVTRNGESLGGQLVSEGLARWYQGGRRSWC